MTLRKLRFDYMGLGWAAKVRVASNMHLIQDSDSQLGTIEQLIAWFDRAVTECREEELRTAVDKYLRGEK